MDDADYISEFEELLKIKEFSQNSKMKMPFDCTYEMIAKALRDEYAENINEKIERWVNVTHVMYFKNVKPVKYYFQAKMLFRDGFYEASITLSRSVCEMICYDLLSKIPQPFGDIESIEVPIFRVFADFLAMPKKIGKSIFEEKIIGKIDTLGDRNFIKSSYDLDTSTDIYNFKIACGQKRSNLQRSFEIFKKVGFKDIDSFRNDTHQYLHSVYDIGNSYAHAKENRNPPKEDATQCLNMLTHILSDSYGINESLENKTIKSGYSDFPDICDGMSFALGFALTPTDAQRVYLNLPSQEHMNSMMQTIGTWKGEWKDEKGEKQTGILSFFSNRKDHLNANLKYKEETESMEIRLFGSYFHLIGFDEEDLKHRKGEQVFFELEFFNEELLIGRNVEHTGKVVFNRISR